MKFKDLQIGDKFLLDEDPEIYDTDIVSIKLSHNKFNEYGLDICGTNAEDEFGKHWVNQDSNVKLVRENQ